jgi:hypothetical protein
MKKDRPATMLSALSALDCARAVAAAIFENTTTLGIRRTAMTRQCLLRRHETVDTPYGPIRVKIAMTPAGTVTTAPEYDDCLEAARRAGVPLREVYAAALRRRL